jgi:hypothetical protein
MGKRRAIFDTDRDMGGGGGVQNGTKKEPVFCKLPLSMLSIYLLPTLHKGSNNKIF